MVVEIGCSLGLSVVADGELQMKYVVAMGYDAIIVGVGLVFAFPVVPLLLLTFLVFLVFSSPEWKYPYLCLGGRVSCYLQLCLVI